MLRMEAMAECMGDHIIRHDTTMPGYGQIAETLNTTCRFINSFHGFIISLTGHFGLLCHVSVRMPIVKN